MATRPSSPVLGLSLRCDQRAPRLARCALEDALDAATVLEDARLLASELVNDALRHSTPDDIIRVAAHLDDGFLVISVHRPVTAPAGQETRHPAEDPDARGLGMRVVERVAARWGTENPDGHRVWAALALDAA